MDKTQDKCNRLKMGKRIVKNKFINNNYKWLNNKFFFFYLVKIYYISLNKIKLYYNLNLLLINEVLSFYEDLIFFKSYVKGFYNTKLFEMLGGCSILLLSFIGQSVVWWPTILIPMFEDVGLNGVKILIIFLFNFFNIFLMYLFIYKYLKYFINKNIFKFSKNYYFNTLFLNLYIKNIFIYGVKIFNNFKIGYLPFQYKKEYHDYGEKLNIFLIKTFTNQFGYADYEADEHLEVDDDKIGHDFALFEENLEDLEIAFIDQETQLFSYSDIYDYHTFNFAEYKWSLSDGIVEFSKSGVFYKFNIPLELLKRELNYSEFHRNSIDLNLYVLSFLFFSYYYYGLVYCLDLFFYIYNSAISEIYSTDLYNTLTPFINIDYIGLDKINQYDYYPYGLVDLNIFSTFEKLQLVTDNMCFFYGNTHIYTYFFEILREIWEIVFNFTEFGDTYLLHELFVRIWIMSIFDLNMSLIDNDSPGIIQTFEDNLLQSSIHEILNDTVFHYTTYFRRGLFYHFDFRGWEFLENEKLYSDFEKKLAYDRFKLTFFKNFFYQELFDLKSYIYSTRLNNIKIFQNKYDLLKMDWKIFPNVIKYNINYSVNDYYFFSFYGNNLMGYIWNGIEYVKVDINCNKNSYNGYFSKLYFESYKYKFKFFKETFLYFSTGTNYILYENIPLLKEKWSLFNFFISEVTKIIKAFDFFYIQEQGFGSESLTMGHSVPVYNRFFNIFCLDYIKLCVNFMKTSNNYYSYLQGDYNINLNSQFELPIIDLNDPFDKYQKDFMKYKTLNMVYLPQLGSLGSFYQNCWSEDDVAYVNFVQEKLPNFLVNYRDSFNFTRDPVNPDLTYLQRVTIPGFSTLNTGLPWPNSNVPEPVKKQIYHQGNWERFMGLDPWSIRGFEPTLALWRPDSNHFKYFISKVGWVQWKVDFDRGIFRESKGGVHADEYQNACFNHHFHKYIPRILHHRWYDAKGMNRNFSRVPPAYTSYSSTFEFNLCVIDPPLAHDIFEYNNLMFYDKTFRNLLDYLFIKKAILTDDEISPVYHYLYDEDYSLDGKVTHELLLKNIILREGYKLNENFFLFNNFSTLLKVKAKYLFQYGFLKLNTVNLIFDYLIFYGEKLSDLPNLTKPVLTKVPYDTYKMTTLVDYRLPYLNFPIVNADLHLEVPDYYLYLDVEIDDDERNLKVFNRHWWRVYDLPVGQFVNCQKILTYDPVYAPYFFKHKYIPLNNMFIGVQSFYLGMFEEEQVEASDDTMLALFHDTAEDWAEEVEERLLTSDSMVLSYNDTLVGNVNMYNRIKRPSSIFESFGGGVRVDNGADNMSSFQTEDNYRHAIVDVNKQFFMDYYQEQEWMEYFLDKYFTSENGINDEVFTEYVDNLLKDEDHVNFGKYLELLIGTAHKQIDFLELTFDPDFEYTEEEYEWLYKDFLRKDNLYKKILSGEADYISFEDYLTLPLEEPEDEDYAKFSIGGVRDLIGYALINGNIPQGHNALGIDFGGTNSDELPFVINPFENKFYKFMYDKFSLALHQEVLNFSDLTAFYVDIENINAPQTEDMPLFTPLGGVPENVLPYLMREGVFDLALNGSWEPYAYDFFDDLIVELTDELSGEYNLRYKNKSYAIEDIFNPEPGNYFGDPGLTSIPLPEFEYYKDKLLDTSVMRRSNFSEHVNMYYAYAKRPYDIGPFWDAYKELPAKHRVLDGFMFDEIELAQEDQEDIAGYMNTRSISWLSGECTGYGYISSEMDLFNNSDSKLINYSLLNFLFYNLSGLLLLGIFSYSIDVFNTATDSLTFLDYQLLNDDYYQFPEFDETTDYFVLPDIVFDQLIEMHFVRFFNSYFIILVFCFNCLILVYLYRLFIFFLYKEYGIIFKSNWFKDWLWFYINLVDNKGIKKQHLLVVSLNQKLYNDRFFLFENELFKKNFSFKIPLFIVEPYDKVYNELGDPSKLFGVKKNDLFIYFVLIFDNVLQRFIFFLLNKFKLGQYCLLFILNKKNNGESVSIYYKPKYLFGLFSYFYFMNEYEPIGRLTFENYPLNKEDFYLDGSVYSSTIALVNLYFSKRVSLRYLKAIKKKGLIYDKFKVIYEYKKFVRNFF